MITFNRSSTRGPYVHTATVRDFPLSMAKLTSELSHAVMKLKCAPGNFSLLDTDITKQTKGLIHESFATSKNKK